MKKSKYNPEDDLYEDEDYYDDDDYYNDDYYAEEDGYNKKKPQKNIKGNNSNTNTNNTKISPSISQPSKNKKESNDFIIEGMSNKKNKKKNKNKGGNTNNDNKNNININNTNENKNKDNTIIKKETENKIEKKISSENNTINLNLDIKKTSSNFSSQSGISSSSNHSNTEHKSKPTKEKENEEKTVSELNNLIYPKIEYKYNLSNSKDTEKSNINLVIIGHVDSGKSTMIGHLLYLLNEIDTKDLRKKNQPKSKKSQNTSTDKNRNTSISYAWATDEGTDERERGVTIDIGYKQFSTKTKNITALDAPGHRDFIQNMISGTSSADAALLVIDSGMQAFDAGFFREGQTKEHALLAKTLGVEQLIVAINKLELFNWQEKRFQEIVEILTKYLIDELGFKKDHIFFVPVSGLTGEGLISKIPSDQASWYTGPTLIELIDSLESPPGDMNGPVRFVIKDISQSSINGLQGLTLFGKVESGIIEYKQEYLISPVNVKYKIRVMGINKKKVEQVLPGQQAELLLDIPRNIKEERIEQGNILSSVKYSVPTFTKFKACIKTYDIKIPISLGQKMMIFLQEQKAEVSIKKIESIHNEGSTISKNNTRFIPKNFYANIVIQSEKKICGELFTRNKKLSTFVLRVGGATNAIGYITEFIE